MRKVPFNKRLEWDATASDLVEVVLIKISHPDLGFDIRLSSDPTELLSTEPLEYGTRSNWLTPDAETFPFKFVVMSAMVPDDKEETATAGTVVLEMVDNRMGEQLRSTTERAVVDMCVVYSESLNLPEMQWRNLRLLSAEGNQIQVQLSFSREPILSEPWPSDRMTKYRFPGLVA